MENLEECKKLIEKCRQEAAKRLVGQEKLIDDILTAFIAGGHVLVEGVPGLAKTLAVKTFSEILGLDFKRIQFTPDLLPADVTGTLIYEQNKGTFSVRKGPIFANVVLADEINRAPAKVQSALLEAMAECQVSVGGKQYKLPQLFLVLATQNPIEQEGTYNLPEAQLDRFLMYIKIDQPDAETEHKILKLVRQEQTTTKEQDKNWQEFSKITGKLAVEDILKARREVLDVHVSEQLEEYLVQLIVATRTPEKYDASLKDSILYGASPRATIALDKCDKINAWLEDRDFVTPDDIHAVVYDVLRHRIILSFEAEAEGISADDIITSLLKSVPLP